MILPDTITELDLFATLPDPEDLLREPEARAPGQDPTLLDFGMSQIMDSQTPTRPKEKRTLQLDDDDLGLDLGLDMDNDITRLSEAPSIERGRRAPTPRRDETTLLEDDDLGLDFGRGDSDQEKTFQLDQEQMQEVEVPAVDLSGFISNLMEGQMHGWAPELRENFSLEALRKAGDRKRLPAKLKRAAALGLRFARLA